MERNTLCWHVLILIIGIAGVVQAQLVAVDDPFAVPVAQELIVEAPGVLENDTYNGEPAAEAGATVELVAGPLTGILECGSNPGLELCPDGSFSFTPGAGFSGSDSFTYRAMVGIETAVAQATLSACQGGPSVVSTRMVLQGSDSRERARSMGRVDSSPGRHRRNWWRCSMEESRSVSAVCLLDSSSTA